MKRLSAESLRILREFSSYSGGFRCNAGQASSLAKATAEAIQLIADLTDGAALATHRDPSFLESTSRDGQS